MIRTSYPLNKVLTAIARQHATKEALDEADLAGHTLTDEERAALKSGDRDALYRLGANPYLIRRVFRPKFTV